MRGRLALLALSVSFGVSCGGVTLARETRASNARSDDPWLAGEPCAEEAQHEAALPFEVLAAGIGTPLAEGATVRVHYKVSTTDGSPVHDSHNDGPPVEVVIGSTKTICGFQKSLVGMRAGEERRVLVPWRLAFGESGRTPDIAPRTDLVFVIDLYLPADAPSDHGGTPVNPLTRGRGR